MNDLFLPKEQDSDNDVFIVEFHGTFIPLQGIETILEAAHFLEKRGESIRFHLFGKGQTYKRMRMLSEKLKLFTVKFFDSIPLEKIPQAINNADICLGIFGTTKKADRVIPTKAYEILLCGKPMITGRTTAAMRVLCDREAALLSAVGSGEELAERILELKENPKLREHIAKNGHTLSLERFQPQTIVIPLVQWIRAHSFHA